MGYLESRENKVFANAKAETKLRDFKAGLTEEERTALEL